MGSTVQKIEPLEPFLSLFRPLLRCVIELPLGFNDCKRLSYVILVIFFKVSQTASILPGF